MGSMNYPGIVRVALVVGFVAMRAAAAAAAGTPEAEFAELKVRAPDGRPWRVAREDWDGAKARVASDPAWRAWLRRERADVDAWMATRRDRVSWACGWYHDFVSPQDGSHLTWTPQIPGEEVAFLHSPSDPRVALTPKLMGGWVFFFRSKHAEMMLRAAQLFRLTGEPRYADWAAEQLDFYAAHYREWQPQRKDQGARLFWQTLDEATVGTKYIEVVRLLGGGVEAARRRRWWDQFFHPVAEVLNHGFESIHNIANWHRCAVAEFALEYHDDALWHEAIDGRYGVKAQVAQGITADYLWWEQSFHYNEFVVEAHLSLFTAAGLAGRAGELAHEMAVSENLMLAPLSVRFPNGLLPNPADGTGIEVVPHRAFLAGTYRVFPTTIGLAEAAQRHDWATLLDPPPPVSPPETLPPVVSRNLEASRMAVLRRGPWQVFFHYGQLTKSHAQAEALNFSVSYGDVDVSHDPGTTGYGSAFHRDYFTRGLNHNVPLVNGEGEVPPQPGGLREFSAERGRVTAEQPAYRPGVAAARTLQVEDGRLTDRATVRSTRGTPEVLGLALHVQGKVALPADFRADPAFAEGRPAAFGFWRDVTRTTGRDEASFVVDYGTLKLRVTIAVPGKFTIWHGSTPDVPPARREGFYVETLGREATFTTTFEPERGP